MAAVMEKRRSDTVVLHLNNTGVEESASTSSTALVGTLPRDPRNGLQHRELA
jgi:hypothetical protein